MNDYLAFMFVIAGAGASWYCRRWGRADGYAEGYEAGRAKGLLEGAGVVAPSLASGGPRERA